MNKNWVLLILVGLLAACSTAEVIEAPQPTATPLPPTATSTPTPEPTATNTQEFNENSSCYSATLIGDFATEENIVILPNDSFSKAWRIVNSSECTWNTGYQLIFYSGHLMNAPSTIFLPHSVAPGGTVDIQIVMTAPSVQGIYRGDWILRSDDGVSFGVNGNTTLTVQIEVESSISFIPSFDFVPPVNLELGKSIYIPHFGFRSGSGTRMDVFNNQFASTYKDYSNPSNNNPEVESYNPEIYYSNLLGIGDIGGSDNYQMKGYVQFDISSIPIGSTINSAYFVIDEWDIIHSPFDIGCFTAFSGDYFPIKEEDDYDYSDENLNFHFCHIGDLDEKLTSPELVNSIQNKLGSNYYEMRFNFFYPTNNNNQDDYIELISTRLEINYSPIQSEQNEETPTENVHLTEEITPDLVLATMNMNLNCRFGPNQVFNIIITFLEEQTALVVGRNEYSSWYQVYIPESLETCWVWGEGIEISGDLASVKVVETPLLPNTETPTPGPTKTSEPESIDCADYTNQDSCDSHPECHWNGDIPEPACLDS